MNGGLFVVVVVKIVKTEENERMTDGQEGCKKMSEF
jgi:hypothetical protein